MSMQCSALKARRNLRQVISALALVAFASACSAPTDPDIPDKPDPEKPDPEQPGGGGGGVNTTYRLESMAVCEPWRSTGNGDPCGPAEPKPLPFCMGSSCILDIGGTGTVHGGEMVLSDDGTWRLVIVEDQLNSPRVHSVHQGRYTTSGNQITFIRQGCENLPYYGATGGANLVMLYSSSCHTGFEFVMRFAK